MQMKYRQRRLFKITITYIILAIFTILTFIKYADNQPLTWAGSFSVHIDTVNTADHQTSTVNTAAANVNGTLLSSSPSFSFNHQIQDWVKANIHPYYDHDAFNPSIFTYKDQFFATFRVSNGSYCRGHHHHPPPKHGRLVLCKLIDTADTYSSPSLSPSPPLQLDAPTCTEININPATGIDWASQGLDYEQHPNYAGIDDTRAFVFQDSIYLTVMVTAMLRNHHTINIVLFKLELTDTHTNTQLNVRVSQGIPVSLWCREIEADLIQKNWMPLVMNMKRVGGGGGEGGENKKEEERLYFVTRLSPALTIVGVDIDQGRCTLASQSYHEELLELRGNTAFIHRVDEKKVLESYESITNSNRMEFIGAVHSVHDNIDEGKGRKKYLHHLVKLQLDTSPSQSDNNNAMTISEVEVVSVSKPFWLPREPGFEPIGYAHGFQFIMGLVMYKGDLIASYGDGDCMSNIAVLPGNQF